MRNYVQEKNMIEASVSFPFWMEGFVPGVHGMLGELI
jgi:hypothetical protein